MSRPPIPHIDTNTSMHQVYLPQHAVAEINEIEIANSSEQCAQVQLSMNGQLS